MGQLKDLIPLNLKQERERFLSDTAYNPQFEYARNFKTSELTLWGAPQSKLVAHARQMLEKHGIHHQDTSPRIDQTYIQTRITEFNERYQLQDQAITVVYAEHTTSRCRISHDTIYFKLPITYTQSYFDDLYRHELETHMLRRLNNRQQSWKHTKDPVAFRQTEEGLAALHSHLFREDTVAYKAYLNYVTIDLSQRLSFSEVHRELLKLGLGTEAAWDRTLRAKRGLKDTSLPGGYTKDLTYLEGMIVVWQWLQDPNHDPRDLYLGRISTADVAELKSQAETEGLRYPTFFNDLRLYREEITAIGTRNHFDLLG